MTQNIPQEQKQTEEEIPEGLTGCAIVGGPAALLGLRKGAAYGFETGRVGAFGRGPLNAFIGTAATTVLGAVTGAVTFGAAGCAAGYAGERYVAEEMGTIPVTPSPTPSPSTTPDGVSSNLRLP